MNTYCTCCKQECFTHQEDHGIGPYEFWGMTGNDKQLVTISDCCDAEVTEDRPESNEEENA